MNESTPEIKQKKPFVIRFLLGFLRIILILLLTIIVLLGGWGAYSLIDRKTSLDYMPRDFYAYVHTDKVYESVEPLLDLKASDVILGADNMQAVRGAFMSFRASKIRNNILIKKAVNTTVDAALYPTEDNSLLFNGVVNLGILSSVSRLSSFIIPRLKLDMIKYSEDGFVEISTKQMTVYIKPYHNLAIVSNNKELLQRALLGNAEYTSSERYLITKQNNKSINIFMDTRSILSRFNVEETMLADIVSIVNTDSLSEISFSITNQDINLKAEIPLENIKASRTSMPILKSSTVPKLPSKLSGNVQYYTLLNAGSLESLKVSTFPYINKKTDIDSIYNASDTICKSVFNISLDDLLFSWTGSEFALLGIEHQNDPILAIEVKDEKKRLEIFNSVLNGYLLKEDNNLIIDGSRLNRISLPPFIVSLLKVLDINLDLPYYFVKDGYIYFSQSAECLSNFYSAKKSIALLKDTDSYKDISSKLDSAIMASLYYNLKKTVPFFVRSKSDIAQVLNLYPLGRCDLAIKSDYLVMEISAIAQQESETVEVPGFPKKLNGQTNGYLSVYNGKSKSFVYWVENKSTVKSMEVPSTRVQSLDINEECFVEAVDNDKVNDSCCWVVTQSGIVYLLDQSLNNVTYFPMESYVKPSGRPVALDDKIIFASVDGVICIIDTNGNISYISVETFNNNITGINALKGKKDSIIITLYDKGFIGTIYQVIDNKNDGQTKAFEVNDLGFGCPDICIYKNKVYTGFISQSGVFNLYNEDGLVEDINVELNDIFFTNVKAGYNCFYGLSSSGVLSKINLDGSVTSVKVCDNAEVRESFIKENFFIDVITENDKDSVYVCAYGNVIYCFNNDLELKYGYPVTGYKKTVRADVNGDNKKDLFALSIDDKLYCYNLD